MYQSKITLAFFHSSITTVIMGMCELLISGILSHFFPRFLANTTYFRNVILLAFFSKVLYFLILYLLAHYVIRRKKNRQYNDITTIFLGLVPIASCIITLTIVHLCNDTYFSSYTDYMIILCAILLLAINLLVFSVHQFNQKKSQEFMEMQLLLQKEEDTANYYEMLLQQSENQSILIHDIKKHLQSIAILNEKRDYPQIASYIEQLQMSSGLKETVRLCDNQILNAILCRYQRTCIENNISFVADIRSETVQILAENDITTIFCNLLDNAIEAAFSVSKAFIELNVHKRNGTPLVIITMVNSCRKNPFSDNHQLVSQKTNKKYHGFGMKSIKRTIKKYDGALQVYYNKDTMTFHTIITLKSCTL